MEIAVRWSQRSSAADPHFLIADVTGRTFKYCRANGIKNGRFQWEEISRNSKAPSFRAFDWSLQYNVVAVGQWSGEATILSLEDPSRSLSIPIKSQRQCNAVSFNPESLLATGLERVRNDFCLNIYDINQWAVSQTPSSSSSKHQGAEPIRKLATSEGITSIKFFPQQPQVLVAGVKGACARIYDLRDNTGNPALQFQTLCVHNIAVNPCDENNFASAGPVKDSTVHVWDRRTVLRPHAGSTTPVNHLATQEGPVLELRDLFKSERESDTASIWSLRYSITDNGCLGVLGSNGGIKVIKTKAELHQPEEHLGQKSGQDQYMQPIHVSRSETLGQMYHPRPRLRNQNREERDRILAFDFVNILSPRHKPCAITLKDNQDISVQDLRREPPTVVSSIQSTAAVTMCSAAKRRRSGSTPMDGIRVYRPARSEKISQALARLQLNFDMTTESNVTPSTRANGSAEEVMSDGWNDVSINGPESFSKKDTLQSSHSGSDTKPMASLRDALLLSDIPRRRCFEGYLLDPAKNSEIVRGDKDLEWMWDWIGGVH